MEVNKGEAERCRDMGAEAIRSSNYPRAVKLLNKSLQMYPLPGVEALLAQANGKLREQATSSNASGPARPTAPPNRSSSTASAASTNTQTGSDGRAYTQEQVKIVNQVLRSKEGGRGAHYRILGIRQDCSQQDIKKGYRKLSLKVHPDKNSAPHADEAFKAVGLAYATLSDPQKKTIYDRYGEEDPDNRGGGGAAAHRGGGVHMRHGQDVNPEDIFNMFFGGGTGRMNAGGPGFHVYSNGFRPQRAAPRGQRPQGQQQGQQQQAAQAPGLGALFQFLPIILILLLSFFNYEDGGGSGGNMPGEGKYFSLTHKTPFTTPLATRLTSVKEIPYFVTDKFLRTYYRDRYQLSQVERMVEKAYEQYLVNECKSQRSYQSRLVKAAQKEINEQEAARQLKAAEAFELSRCSELEDLFPNRQKKTTSGKRKY